MQNNNNTPLVSVIMGIYNCADTLSEAVDSILAQTYSNWELIMCDDASTDNTYAVAKEYQEKYSDKIILIQNEKNSYLSYSLNHCLQYASGKYIARMDGDDRSDPHRFEKQVMYLQSHHDIDLVGTAMQRFDKKGLGVVFSKPEFPDKYSMKTMVPYNHATILTYKYVYDELDGYIVSDRTARCEDYDLWFRFYSKGFKGANISEALYFVREEESAFKRRTIKGRWNGFKTTCIGFKLLKFPVRWLIKPAFYALIKSITPPKIMMIYHQKKHVIYSYT